MSQGGFKSLICPPVFAKPSVLAAGSAGLQLGRGDTCIVLLELPVLLLGEDLVHNLHGIFALPDVLLLLGERGRSVSLQSVCRASHPLPGMAKGLSPTTTPQKGLNLGHRGLILELKSHSPPWLIFTHQLCLPVSLLPSQEGFQQRKVYGMGRAPFWGTRTRAEPLGKEHKVPSQASGGRWMVEAVPFSEHDHVTRDRGGKGREGWAGGRAGTTSLRSRARSLGEGVNVGCHPTGCHQSRGTGGTPWCQGAGELLGQMSLEMRDGSLRRSADTASRRGHRIVPQPRLSPKLVGRESRPQATLPLLT